MHSLIVVAIFPWTTYFSFHLNHGDLGAVSGYFIKYLFLHDSELISFIHIGSALGKNKHTLLIQNVFVAK